MKRKTQILKVLGILALTTAALTNAANAGERSPGLLNDGVAVNPGTAVMKGYNAPKTERQMRPQRVPTGRVHRACPNNWYWNGYKCTPRFHRGKVDR